MAAGIVAVAIAFVDRPGVALDVVETKTTRVLWRRVVASGERIELWYTHSVERTPVIEEFRAERGGLRLVAMRFVSQGAGLPTEGYTREDGWFVLRTDQRVDPLPLRASRLAGHRLHLGAEVADLAALAGDGAAIHLTSGPGPLRIRWPLASRSP